MPRQIIQRPTDLLPLNRFLFEIRLSRDNVSESETEAFNQVIDDAVEAVASDSNVPITPSTASVVMPRGEAVLGNYISYFSDPFSLNFIRTRHPVYYATSRNAVIAGVFENQVVLTPTNETINDEDSVGVLSASIDGGIPSNAVALKIEYVRGLVLSSKRIADLRTLSILKARTIFDGTTSVPDHNRSAYERILSKVRYEGVLPETYRQTGLV